MITAQSPSLQIFISAQTVPGADMSSQCLSLGSRNQGKSHSPDGRTVALTQRE